LPTLRRFAGAAAALLVLLAIGSRTAVANDVFVAQGATWKYKDDGSNQGTAWRASGFDDTVWASGPAQLGYGDGDEATVVSYGPNASAKYITTYFRRTFAVANPADYTSLSLRLLRDDGAVVYLNGTEVRRDNMPSGAVSYTTLASVALGAPDESTFFTTSLSTSALVAGTNTIAVEIHQANQTSSDISFDLELTGLTGANVVRGPYLQLGTPTSIHVRWRTDAATDSRVRYGTDPASLDVFSDGALATTEHEVALTGLASSTKYFYSVGTAAAAFASSPDQFFTTSPAGEKPTRIWVIGDAGTGTASQTQVRNSFDAYTGTRGTDLWLMLGDNAYQSGTDAEYQTNVFDVYGQTFEQAVVWPTVGNHDTAQSTQFDPTIPYYQIFTLPKNAEAGGVASGTEAYYSFDYGNIHFVCLDSMTSDRSPTGPMATWLATDLAQTTKEWLVAYWHHPPYSKGSHDSDTDLQMSEMRQNIVPILESYGVDLVLTGHSHSYERSFLIDGHYGVSSTWDPATMLKQGGSGQDPTPYAKPGTEARAGAVYAVAGSSGQTSGGTLDHPAMYVSFSRLGSLVLDIDGNRLDAKFLRETATPGVPGSVDDSFSVVKVDPVELPPLAPSGLAAEALSATSIRLRWTVEAANETGFSVERSRDRSIWTTVATLGTDAVAYTDSGLRKNTLYHYRVRETNAAGASPASNVAGARTFKK
jgi:hypothetical protein